MISEDDLQALTIACRDGDQAALDLLVPRLGLAIDLAALDTLRAWSHKLLKPIDLARLALQARDAEHGLAFAIRKAPRSPASSRPLDWECALAVRDATSVVVGLAARVGAPAKVANAWPALSPWSAPLARNRQACEQWARAETLLRIPMVARPELVGTHARVTEDELMREIIRHPEDAAPRLVLADLLMQRQDVRGELIHLEHRLKDTTLDHATLAELRDRIATLVGEYRTHLAGKIGEYVREYTIVGGFVDSVVMSVKLFRGEGERLFALQPIRELVLRPCADVHLRKLAATAHLDQVRALELGGGSSDRLSLVPFHGRPLPRLEQLTIAHCQALDDSLATLDAPRLRSFWCIGSVALSPEALQGLARNSRIAVSLEELVVVHGMPLDPKDESLAARVFAHWRLPALRVLELDRCWFTTNPDRMATLIRGALNLQTFVKTGETGREEIEALLECNGLETLQLDVQLDLPTLERVLALPHLTSLMFRSGTDKHSARIVERLLALPTSHSLRRLRVVNSQVFDPSIERGGSLNQRFPWPVPRPWID